jgi:capsular exopolysaccharide synthesis family protein
MPQDAGLPDPSSDLNSTGRRDATPVAGRIEPPAGPRLATPPPPALSAPPDLSAMLQALRRRWAAAVLLGGTLATIAGLAAWFLLTPKHTAVAIIRVGFIGEEILREGKSLTQNDFRTYQATTAAQLVSRNIVVSALKRDEVRRLNLDTRETDPVSMVLEDAKVDFKETSELVTLLFPHSDPQVATVVAQAMQDSYMDDIVYAEKNARVKRVNELQKAYDASVETLKTKKANLADAAQRLGSNEPKLWAERRQENLMALRDLKQKQVDAGMRLLEAGAALEAFDQRVKFLKQDKLGGITDAMVEDALDSDPKAAQLRDRIDRLDILIRDYEARGAGGEPTPKAARVRIKEVRRLLNRRRVIVAGKLRRARKMNEAASRDDSPIYRAQLQKTVDSLTEMAGKIDKEIKRLTRDVARAHSGASEYEQLQEDVRSFEKIVDNLNNNLNREKIELRAADRISPYQRAELMKRDIKKQLLASIAAPVAVLFGVCAGLAWFDVRQRRIRSAGQVSRGLGIRVVGAVPEVPNLERQLVGPSGEPVLEGHPVLESIDALRTFVLHEADARRTRLVMVTSATLGEGKTTLASHLATSLARAGRKTLLIDGDLRRPTVHELFELPMQPGFSEILLGEVEVTEACQETSVENLALIPAGQWDREVLQALARDGLEGVFDKLQQEFDFILIDSHPVLPAPDSLLIGRHVDAVILSVLREVSQLPKVYAAAQRLTSLNIRVLGAVVSGTDPEDVFAGVPGVASAAA